MSEPTTTAATTEVMAEAPAVAVIAPETKTTTDPAPVTEGATETPASATEAEGATSKPEKTEVPKEKKSPTILQKLLAPFKGSRSPKKERKALEKESKPVKVSRRISARVGELFKPKPKKEVAPAPKADEPAPKIEEPERVAPLETPAPAMASAVEEPAAETKTEETPAAPPAAPAVAAAA
ncbi:uncharacterized protein EI90DRAFT_50512 [Cantharellus anzutake]|uniref:uncharacterized protein n=1 Tax=Cantharellus anzutake TaxID=1750568 RepID=UPI0019076CFE|nr:uncharacterized protein EI90DRAFT_50512 [Cantharellus anzutake]KAF8344138.1 hypothetical protein EI90DRAFT_50512 [Cantharellus anzutake]